MTQHTLDVIKTRRVIRNMTDQPVSREQLEKILEAARWAPTGGNQRVHRFIAVQNPTLLRLLRMVSPGMFQQPQSIILICIDWDKVAANKFPTTDRGPYVDLGVAMQTMMLAAHSIGLGSGPVTSFSKAAARIILNLPQHLSPEVMVCLGHPAPAKQLPMRNKKKVTWQSLTIWDRFEE
jgi:nitroreductase